MLNRIVALVLLSLGVVFSQGKSPDKPLDLQSQMNTLQAQLKGMQSELEKTRYEAQVQKEYYEKSHGDINGNLGTFINGGAMIATGIFAFLAIISIVNYRITRNDVQHVKKEISDEIEAKFLNEIESFRKKHLGLESRLGDIESTARNSTNKIIADAKEWLEKVKQDQSSLVEGEIKFYSKLATSEACFQLNREALGCEYLIDWYHGTVDGMMSVNSWTSDHVFIHVENYLDYMSQRRIAVFRATLNTFRKFAQTITRINERKGKRIEELVGTLPLKD